MFYGRVLTHGDKDDEREDGEPVDPVIRLCLHLVRLCRLEIP